MDPTLILELSSDEEVGFDNSSTADNFDWITKLFEDDPPHNSNQGLLNPSYNNGGHGVDDDDSDDVVVVGEVIVDKPKKPKILVSRNYEQEGDDDDCVVLDGDPDKAKDEDVKDDKKTNNTINSEKEIEDDDSDSDDLLIVGEKGQVACRDFPHARHNCAKYPFSSTPHESCCDMCHCYVCDSLAPCAQWGSGVSGTDHCHATDKKEYWKLERTRFRQLKNPPPLPMPVNKLSNGSLPHSPQLHQISRGPNQLLRLSTNGGISRRLRSSIAIASNRFQPNLVSRQLLRSCNNGNAQIQGNRGASLLPRNRMVSSRPIFKRSGVTSRPVAGLCQSAYRLPSNVSVAYLQMPNQQLTGQPAENNSTNSMVSSLHSESDPAFPPSSTSSMSHATFLNLHLQGYSHPSPHTPTSQYNVYEHSADVVSNSNPYTYAPMNQSQNVPSLALPLPSERHSSVTQNISGPTPDGITGSSPRSHQTSAELSYSSPVFSCTTSNAWNAVTPSCQQSTVENSLVESAVPMNELLPSIEQSGPPSENDSEPALYFDMDYWLHDDGPVINSQESFVFDVNNQASVPEPVDAGMLYFDFETSMKGLTNS